MATGKSPCPCQKCKGTKSWEWITITRHMRSFGIWSEYVNDMDCTEDNQTDFLKSLHMNGRDKPLCDGISTTLLQGVSMLLSLYSTYPGISQAYMTALLGVIGKHFLPPGNILPRTFDAAKAVISDLLPPIEKIEMCKNKCIIYTKENAQLAYCPKCNEARSPKHKYPYMPIIPRIRRWMSIPQVAKALQSHLPPVRSETERMTDIQQSPAWTAAMEEMQDPRCLVFGLSTDGVDPFNHLHIPYSMWPITLKVFNLPPEIRDAFAWTLFCSLVPGPNTPTDMNPFLGRLVDEFVELHRGVPMYDAYKKEPFDMRGKIGVSIADMPAGHKIHKTTNAGALSHSCWHCDQPGETVRAYHQVLYLGNERFLPLDSSLRAKLSKPGEESDPAPCKKRKEELYAYGRAVEVMKERVSRGETTMRALEQMEKSTGKKGLEELHRLPYYDPVVCRPVEPMHAIQVLVKRIFSLINGHVDPFKTLDAEKTLGRFTNVVNDPQGRRRRRGEETTEVLYPPWALDKDGLEIADRRCLQIQVPHGFGWKPKPFFTKPPYMKSYEWMKVGTCNILPYTLQDLLGSDQMLSLSKFLDCLRDICLPDISDKEARELGTRINLAVAEMELHWPKRINTIMMHMMHHVSESISHFGPVRSRWMFGPERFNSFLSRRITKRDTPEINVMEKCRIYDLTQLLALLGHIPEGAIMTDPGAQLKAVTDARRDLDGQLAEDSEEQEGAEEEQVEEHAVPGLDFLTRQFRRPEPIKLSEHDVAMVAATTNVSAVVSRDATRFYSAKLQKPREYVLSCALVDKPNSGVCSSYIGGLSPNGNVMFGRVSYFVDVCLNVTDHVELALVEWQPTPQLSGGMWTVDCSEVACHPPSFVKCELLPPPLVTAWASETLLYFLDANASRMPRFFL